MHVPLNQQTHRLLQLSQARVQVRQARQPLVTPALLSASVLELLLCLPSRLSKLIHLQM